MSFQLTVFYEVSGYPSNITATAAKVIDFSAKNIQEATKIAMNIWNEYKDDCYDNLVRTPLSFSINKL